MGEVPLYRMSRKLYETCKDEVDFVGISNEQAEPVPFPP